MLWTKISLICDFTGAKSKLICDTNKCCCLGGIHSVRCHREVLHLYCSKHGGWLFPKISILSELGGSHIASDRRWGLQKGKEGTRFSKLAPHLTKLKMDFFFFESSEAKSNLNRSISKSMWNLRIKFFDTLSFSKIHEADTLLKITHGSQAAPE